MPNNIDYPNGSQFKDGWEDIWGSDITQYPEIVHYFK